MTAIRSDEQTMLELMLGNAIYGVLGILILLIFPDRAYNEIGFVWGVLVSCAMTYHIYVSLRKAIDMREEGALKHTRMTYGIRVFMILAAFALLAWLGVGNIITGLIGLFALKLSAYIQQFTHKILEKKFMRKGR